MAGRVTVGVRTFRFRSRGLKAAFEELLLVFERPFGFRDGDVRLNNHSCKRTDDRSRPTSSMSKPFCGTFGGVWLSPLIGANCVFGERYLGLAGTGGGTGEDTVCPDVFAYTGLTSFAEPDETPFCRAGGIGELDCCVTVTRLFSGAFADLLGVVFDAT